MFGSTDVDTGAVVAEDHRLSLDFLFRTLGHSRIGSPAKAARIYAKRKWYSSKRDSHRKVDFANDFAHPDPAPR